MNNDFESVVLRVDSKHDMDFGDQRLDDLPIAMAYVPMQKWQKLYDPDVALDRGTLFCELDLPFLGRRPME